MANTYCVTNGDSDVSGEGMTLERARNAAQREANRVGAARFVESDDEFPSFPPERFEPQD